MASRLVSGYLEMVRAKNDGLFPAKLKLHLIIPSGVATGFFKRHDATNGYVELQMEGYELPARILDSAVISIIGEIDKT